MQANFGLNNFPNDAFSTKQKQSVDEDLSLECHPQKDQYHCVKVVLFWTQEKGKQILKKPIATFLKHDHQE